MECDIGLKHEKNYSFVPDIQTADWTEITKWLKTEGLSFQFSESLIDQLFQIICRCQQQFTWYNSLEAPVAETLTETLKAFRVYITNQHVAAFVIEDPKFYDQFHLLMTCLFTKRNGPELYTKYLLQFFLNLLSVGSEQQKSHTRHKVRDHVIVRNFYCLFYNEYGFFYEACAVIYNLYCDVELTEVDLISFILGYYTDRNKNNEYLDFLVERIITQNFVWLNYGQIWPHCRLELLNYLREMFIFNNSNSLISQVEQLPEACLKCLVDMFNRSAKIVFQVTQQGDCTATKEVSSILELLAHLSSNEKYLPFFQNNKDLLINAGVLLINAHRLGKSSNSVFTPVQKLADIHCPSDNIRRNPVFGFKADLVRLIGNLCWKNKMMQDLAREGELIPILLDSCNIDAKNPFIIQWVILAIRNLCEQNKENQAIIAGLTQQGVISSEVLQEFGLTLHTEEDLSIGIIQLDLNK